METAVDGLISYKNCCFFHSDTEDYTPWLQIDLKEIHFVFKIEVFNRQDSNLYDFEYIQVCFYFERIFENCKHSDYHLKARVGNDDANGIFHSVLTINTDCGTTGLGPDDALFLCPNGTRGRFVTVQRTRVHKRRTKIKVRGWRRQRAP